MKLKAMVYGRNSIEDRKQIPGLGSVSELYVGQSVTDNGGRHGTRIISTMDFDPRSGRVFVRRVDEHGKTNRVWTSNEIIEERNLADFIGVDATGATLLFDDDPKEAQQKR